MDEWRAEISDCPFRKDIYFYAGAQFLLFPWNVSIWYFYILQYRETVEEITNLQKLYIFTWWYLYVSGYIKVLE